MEPKETMSSEEAAVILNYSVEHVNLLCRKGKIRAKKPFGRWIIDASHVRELAGIDELREVKEAVAVGEKHGEEQPEGVVLDI